jgi:CHAT domain-containing protein/Tfp pilus assembly protein PilF
MKAESLTDQAFELSQQGRYEEALPLAEQAFYLTLETVGYDNDLLDDKFYNLGTLHLALRNFEKAEYFLKIALSRYEVTHGYYDPKNSPALRNLALLKASIGEFDEAKSLIKRAHAIVRKAYGSESPQLGKSYNKLGILYLEVGEIQKAEIFFKKALSIFEKAFGPDSPNVAMALNNLARCYAYIGDFSKEGTLLKRSLQIFEKVYGPEHVKAMNTINNLGLHYAMLGKYKRAESLLKRALGIAEKTFGPEHQETAYILNNLASIYFFLDYLRSEQLFKRACIINEKIFGQDDPIMTFSLEGLAWCYILNEDYAEAVDILQRCLAIREKFYGPEHNLVVDIYRTMAIAYTSSGHYEKAHNFFKQFHALHIKVVDYVMGFTSDIQKIRFLSAIKRELSLYLSFVTQYLKENPSAIQDALDLWLKNKGVSLEAQRRFQEALVYSNDPEIIWRLQELAKIRAMLSKLIFYMPGKQSILTHKKRLSDLEAQKERLEAELSSISREFELGRKITMADSREVAEKLPLNTALIEFARIEMADFKITKTNYSRFWKPAHYIVFVLFAGKKAQVEMVDLGDAEVIDRGVSSLKKAIADTKDPEGKGTIETSRHLYKLVFEPLKEVLGEVKELFISPDGNLNLIPFEVLQGPEGKYLIEEFTFNYLATGREILRFGETKGRGAKALLMGNPDFNMGFEQKEQVLNRLAFKRDTGSRSNKESVEMRGLHFRPLPETKEEVEVIRKLLGGEDAECYTGVEALEEVLLQFVQPSILHLATHGFFLSDLKVGSSFPGDVARGIQTMPMFTKPMDRQMKIESPLLRSGILLAGANRALKSSEIEKGDGIVTAEEILGLDLRGTEMVVLSACETGLGEVKTGEGVFGLRRAFTQAGAKSLVMSMWSVPDRETKELMIEFYKNILSKNLNRCQALRQAALKQMNTISRRYGHTNPLYWGAFVFMGEAEIKRSEIDKLPSEPKYSPLVSIAHEIGRDGTFIAYASGIVFDTRTGLEWIVGPDQNISWRKAKSWVESLSVAGGEWRMPTLDELQTLYKHGSGKRNMTPLLKTTGWRVWSGEVRRSGNRFHPWYFRFHQGTRHWVKQSYSNNTRVFAVCSRK